MQIFPLKMEAIFNLEKLCRNSIGFSIFMFFINVVFEKSSLLSKLFLKNSDDCIFLTAKFWHLQIFLTIGKHKAKSYISVNDKKKTKFTFLLSLGYLLDTQGSFNMCGYESSFKDFTKSNTIYLDTDICHKDNTKIPIYWRFYPNNWFRIM